MRSKNVIINTTTDLFVQFVKILIGLVIPALIIKTFGSELNGMVTSITQFIGYIALLQAGISNVVIAALYKPLAKKNTAEISGIIKASERFYLKLSFFMILYAAILAVYFGFSSKEHDFAFSASLVLIISLGTIAEYMIGNTFKQLLTADQRQAVLNITYIVVLLFNFISTYILAVCGFEIRIIKAFSSMFFLLHPLFLKYYATKKYNFIKDIAPNNEALNQRWSSIGHSIAYYVHRRSNVFLITVIMGYYYVSIYSVYAMIVGNLEILFMAFNKSVKSAFGNMLATENIDKILKKFNAYLFIFNVIVMTVFITAMFLTIPFLRIYTYSFNDGNYIQPLIAYWFLSAELLFCIRLPYESIINAAGHFKQTKLSAYIEAGINVTISVIMVNLFGIIGVMIGTVVAVIYRTAYMMYYLNKHIIHMKLQQSASRFIVNLITGFIVIVLLTLFIKVNTANYFQWIILAMPVTIASGLVIFAINTIFFRADLTSLISLIKTLLKLKKNKRNV